MTSRISLLAASLVLVLVGCDPDLAVVDRFAQYRPDCPHTWPDSLSFEDQQVSEAALTGPGPIKNVPEFHDCQRFITTAGAAMQYDSLFGIFATYRLTRLDTLLRVALDDPDLQQPDPEQRLAGDEGLPAAEIVAWGNYPPLEIRVGFNCLYLYLRPDTSGRPEWRSKMVPYGITEQDCSQPVDIDSSPGVELPVTVDRHPRLAAPEDYPAAARWDWDPARRQHYIGIRCGTAWCSVAKPGLTPSRTHAQRLPMQGDDLSDADFRVHHVKGWYDEQLLAVQTSPGGGVQPSRIRGTIIPRPGLDTLNDVSYFSNTWVPMAWIALDVPGGTPNPYEAKLNLHGTPAQAAGAQLNEISLCHGTAAVCLPAGTSVSACGDGEWWAAIENPNGDRMYRCSHRRVMPSGVAIAATVRWRWLLDDEGIWMRCPGGCCDVAAM